MKKLLIILFLLLFTSLLLPVSIKADEPSYVLDIINEYNITIDPLSDGTLNIKYHINWTVLDDEIEGPLTWVKIGTANKHIKNLKNLSEDVVEKIRYYDDSGSFVRVDFIKEYYKGETVDFTFSINQSRIFTLADDGKRVEYGFIPGWFPDSKVTSITIDWKAGDGEIITTGDLIDGYYHTSSSLNFNETIQVSYAYNRDVFPELDPKKDYISYEDEAAFIGFIIVFVIVAAIVVVVIIVKIAEEKSNDGYDANSGFSGHYYWYYPYYMPRHRRMGYNRLGKSISDSRPTVIAKKEAMKSSSGSSCACACACACAGGGRAGCSRKDFYEAHNLEKIKESLNK
ncbi:hypothetical protein J6Y73_04690 [bacterium]|nr:hypothetical protein [bacterium]